MKNLLANSFFLLCAAAVPCFVSPIAAQVPPSPDAGGFEADTGKGSGLDRPLPESVNKSLYSPTSLGEHEGLPQEPEEPFDPKEILEKEVGSNDEDFTSGESLTLSGKEETEVIATNKQPEGPSSTVKPIKSNNTSDLVGAILQEFEQLDGAAFLPQETLRADQPRFRYRGRIHVFQLPFIMAAQPDDPESREARHVANYFLVSGERAQEAGDAALDFLRDLMENNSFQIFTNWDKVSRYGEDSPIYAFVYVEGRPICEYLVEQGLVSLEGERTLLPDGTRSGTHYRVLRDKEQEARNQKLGAWQPEGELKYRNNRILE